LLSQAGWVVRWFTFTAWAFNSNPQDRRGKNGERHKVAGGKQLDPNSLARSFVRVPSVS
jgi:hypothetical protein